MSIFLKFCGRSSAFSLDSTLQDQLYNFFLNLNISSQQLFFSYQGKCVSQLSYQNFQKDTTLHAYISLKGGKGGFGAKLKNQGGKKIKPNDNIFSRDATGRRIEYQNMERDYTEFIKKKMVEDQKVNKQREQFKVMQDTMKQGQSFMKLDKQYNQTLEKNQIKLAESIRIGRMKLMEKNKKEKQQEEKNQLSNQKISLEQKKQQSPAKQQQKKQKNSSQQKEDLQIQLRSQPIKKIKTQEIAVKVQKPVLNQSISAKDKLKSLFKK